MELISDVNAMRQLCEGLRRQVGSLALVPTMGALHDGHLELVRVAGRRAGGVVVSIFVNPTQFGPGEDYEGYPRTMDDDLRALRDLGVVDGVFAPGVDDMYPDGIENMVTQVSVRHLPDHLCGAFRQGHFDGVTTVVGKLLNICRPTLAVFGRKDAQQFVIISRMVRDLDFGVEVVGVETVREQDGLALSSRNKYLTSEERREAVVLFNAVTAAREAILGGERNREKLIQVMTDQIRKSPLAKLQYAEVVGTAALQPADVLSAGGEVLAAVAVFFGGTRLIDNAFVTVPV